MKINNLVAFVIFIGITVLFFFPSPEENFLAYLGVILFFVILIFFLSRQGIKNKKY